MQLEFSNAQYLDILNTLVEKKQMECKVFPEADVMLYVPSKDITVTLNGMYIGEEIAHFELTASNTLWAMAEDDSQLYDLNDEENEYVITINTKSGEVIHCE